MKTEKQIHETTVAEVMTKRVETLTPIDSIKHALNLMSECKLTTVPVIDQHDKCIGILSRSDLTEMFIQEDGVLANALDTDRLSEAWLNRSLDTSDVRTVQELMTYDVATVHANHTIVEACQSMTDNSIHHLPVVDEENRVMGIISAFDIVKAVAGK